MYMPVAALSKPIGSVVKKTFVEMPRLDLDLSEEDDPLESDWHVAAMTLLINTLRHWWRDRSNVYISGNTAVYFDPLQSKRHNFRGPDFYVVKDTQKKPRKSWTTWEEGGLVPDFILELASPSTAQFDLSGKKDIYELQLKTPEYIIYNSSTDQFQGWRMKNGCYRPIMPNKQGQLWCEELGLWLGVIPYDFEDGAGPVNTPRFFESTGQLIPTKDEVQTQRAEMEARRAEMESQRAKAEFEARRAAEIEIVRLKDLLEKTNRN